MLAPTAVALAVAVVYLTFPYRMGVVCVRGDVGPGVDAFRGAHVVDTTGAGDLFAAGFLYGLTQGHGLAESGRLGAIAAAEVISHLGARPEVSLGDLARARQG